MVFIIVIIGLAVLILIHELGHFLVAKLLGMRVDEFGVGFPPRFFGFRKYKGEEALVIFEEKDIQIKIQGEETFIAEKIKEVDRIAPVRFWRFFWGKEKPEEKMDGFSGGTIYSFNLLPFGGFVRLHGEDEPSSARATEGKPAYDAEIGFNEEAAGKKSLVILAGVCMNIILGWLLLSLVLMTGMPKHLVIANVAENSPAFASGLKSGDIIKSISSGASVLSDPIMSDDFTRLVKGNGASPLTLNIERDAKELKFELSPRQNPPEGQGPLGVEITEVGLESQPFFKSLGSGISETWNVTIMVFEGLGTFLRQLFASPGNVQNVTGPVGIVFLAAQATSLGFVYFLQLLALISINLAVLNLLPFPALDGGRFLFILIEKLVRRPIPRQVQLWVNGAGFAILILLMVFITIKDVVRLM